MLTCSQFLRDGKHQADPPGNKWGRAIQKGAFAFAGIALLSLLVVLPALAGGPISVAEAQARLARRIAEREQAATTQPAEQTIEELQRENEQLRASIAEIHAEIDKLQGMPTTQAAVKPFGRIQPGMTRSELMAFIREHQSRIHFVSGHRLSRTQEIINVRYYGMLSVNAWVAPPPGVPDPRDRHPELESRVGNASIGLENRVVVSFTERR